MKRLIVLIIFMFALYPLAAGAQPNVPEYDTDPEEDVQVDKKPEIYQKQDRRDERQREGYMDRDMDRNMDRDHRTYDRDEMPRERDGYREPGEYREDRQRERIRDPEMHE